MEHVGPHRLWLPPASNLPETRESNGSILKSPFAKLSENDPSHSDRDVTTQFDLKHQSD